METDQKSVAVLGGAFDPVHLGHLSLAEDAFAQLDLDEIWFMPTAQSPLKDFETKLTAPERVELIEAGIQPFPYFKVDLTEVNRGGISFTCDTVEELKTAHPDTEFSWIIGGDQLAKLDQWRNISDLVNDLEFIIIERPGFEMETGNIPKIPGLRFKKVESRWLDISSSEIRQRLALGKPVNDLLPKSVAELIVRRNFYK